MNVFLSYASDDRNLAEQVAHSIRARNHTVFFDRTDLPPGASYEKQIQQAIHKAAVMVFLVSPDSVAAGRFTQTELRFAQARWPSASNRVLPVMIRPTPFDDIPNYLRSVTILEPSGNIPAEVAASVDGMQQEWTTRFKSLTAFLAITVIAGSIWLYSFLYSPTFSIEATPPQPAERGFFGEPNLYSIDVVATNEGKVVGNVTNVSFEVDPPDALVVKKSDSNLESEIPSIITPKAEFKSHIQFSEGQTSDSAQWRVCLHFEALEPECSQFYKWTGQDDFAYGDHFPISPALSEKAKAIAWDGANYLIAATSPNRIVRLSESGVVITESELAGIPTALSVGSLGLYVGMAAPDRIARLNFETLKTEAEMSVNFPKALRGTFDEPISNTPRSLAQDGSNLWVITQGGASGNGLAYLDSGLSKLQIPPYYEDVSFDLKGMSLRDGDGVVWSGQNDTTPASISRLSPKEMTTFGGHDYEIASCASDVLFFKGKLLIPDCDGKLIETMVSGSDLRLGRQIDSISGYPSGNNAWPVVRLGQTADDKLLGAVTVAHISAFDSDEKTSASTLGNLDLKTVEKVRLRVSDASIVDMAAGKESALVLLESDSGKRQLAAPELYD